MRALVARLRAGRARRGSQVDPREAYARVATAYPPEAHNGLMRLEQSTVLELLDDPRGRRVLDVGCGSGRYLRLIAERGAALVAGCDFVPEMVARAREISPRVAVARAEGLPFPSAAFDLAVCGLVVGHCRELEPVLAELGRVLRPGGVMVYSDIHPAGTLAGWERSLPDARGRVVPIRQYLHLFGDHVRACRRAGFALEAVAEPVAPEAPAESDGWPVLLVVRAAKVA